MFLIVAGGGLMADKGVCVRGEPAVNTCANGDGPDNGEERQGNWKQGVVTRLRERSALQKLLLQSEGVVFWMIQHALKSF